MISSLFYNGLNTLNDVQHLPKHEICLFHAICIDKTCSSTEVIITSFLRVVTLVIFIVKIFFKLSINLQNTVSDMQCLLKFLK